MRPSSESAVGKKSCDSQRMATPEVRPKRSAVAQNDPESRLVLGEFRPLLPFLSARRLELRRPTVKYVTLCEPAPESEDVLTTLCEAPVNVSC